MSLDSELRRQLGSGINPLSDEFVPMSVPPTSNPNPILKDDYEEPTDEDLMDYLNHLWNNGREVTDVQ